MAKKKNTFEDNIKELEKLTQEMESLDDNLEKAIELYKQGILLAQNCTNDLNKFEKEVYTLKEDFNNKIDIDLFEG